MVPLILDTLPPPSTHLFALASVLGDLLPLPAEVARRDFRAIHDWFEDHKGDLRWDEDAGRFALL
jgi:hypothetical protein